MATDKDSEQDQMIRDNAERITRNEEAIKRQTEALEQIRDHYYPPPEKWWKKTSTFFVKVVCVIVAYLGIAQTVDWLWNVREANSLAANYVKVAERLCQVDGDVASAVSCLEKAIKLNPQESEYVMSLSFLKGMAIAANYLDNDRPPTDAEGAQIDAALAEASVLKELDPKNPMPHVLMAQGYSLRGESEEAVAAIERAVRCAPKKAFVHVSACAINFFSGHVPEARAHLAEAERLNPKLPLILAWKGLLALWADHDASAACANFEKLVQRAPRLPVAHIYLGKALLAQKEPDLKKARAAFTRAITLNAKLKSAMLGMAQVCEREGNPILARLWLNRLLALDAKYLPALLSRARLAVQAGEPAAARDDLTAAIALSPFRADLYRLRAEAHEKAGDAAKAKADRATAAALIRSSKAAPEILRPRCEGMAEAVGVSSPMPQFTWGLKGRGEAAGSEIRVTDGGKEIWRGRGESRFAGTYAGPTLSPGRVYRWQVRLTDEYGNGVTDWTTPQPLVLGLSDEKAWGAACWIGEDRDFLPRLGDGTLAIEFKPCVGRFVVCVRCAPDATGGVAFAAGVGEGAKTNVWNRLDVVCRGTVVEAKLNGQLLARREGTPADGTFAVCCEKGAEARVRDIAWTDATGAEVLHDDYRRDLRRSTVFFRTKITERTLVVEEKPYIHTGLLPKDCPRFRKTFSCGKEIVSAVASVTARGFYELWLNGTAADPNRTLVGVPTTGGGWFFETYDVTALVRRGANTIGLWLSPGYSDDFVTWGPRWLKPKQALVRLDLRYADGTNEAIVSDGSWEYTARSPVVATSIYDGEKIDRSYDDPDWCRPSGSRAVWRPVRVLGRTIADGTGGVRLRSNDMPPIRRFDPRRPVRITEPKKGAFVADFGQNRAGVVEIRVKGPKGTRIRLRTSEILGKDGMIDPWTNGPAKSTDEFILAGTGEVETFLPRFTYHGFHYVEITGWPGAPTANDLTDWAVGADVEETSSFTCSNAGLNWLHNAAYWSMRSNLMAFPADCCMRDERVGCCMDSQAFEDSACQFFDMRRFHRAWLEMIGAGGPNPDWSGDATTLAARLWKYYGDRRTYVERYDFMKTACGRIFDKSPSGVWEKGYGDWCAPNKGTWASFFNDVGIVNTAIFTEMLAATAEAASVLGKSAEAKDYAAKREKVIAAFERQFRNQGTYTYGDGSQATFVMPLAYGLVPENDRAAVTAKLMETIRLKDRVRFNTGIFGTRYIGDVLLDAGEKDLFVDLFTQTNFPGFGYMAAQGGTTLWEQWPFRCSMDSHNHAMMSGAASCLYTHLAGIRPAKPGYAEILVKPVFPSALNSLEATRQTPRGEVSVSWRREKGDIALTVRVPPFTPATLSLPDGTTQELAGETTVKTIRARR